MGEFDSLEKHIFFIKCIWIRISRRRKIKIKNPNPIQKNPKPRMLVMIDRKRFSKIPSEPSCPDNQPISLRAAMEKIHCIRQWQMTNVGCKKHGPGDLHGVTREILGIQVIGGGGGGESHWQTLKGMKIRINNAFESHTSSMGRRAETMEPQHAAQMGTFPLLSFSRWWDPQRGACWLIQ